MDLVIFALIFLISAYLMSVAYVREQDERNYKFFLVICGLLLIIPAGIRSNEVGTDIGVYQQPLFSYALMSQSLRQYFAFSFVSDVEVLYSVLVYLVAKITGNINVLFFVEEALIIYPMIFCIWHYRDRVEPSYVLLAYEGLFYFDSYNIVRQWLAIAIGMSALIMWEDRHIKRCIVLLIISILIHKSAIMMIGVLVLYEVFKKMEHGWLKRFLILMIAIFTLVFSIHYQSILRYFVKSIPLLRERYGLSSYMLKEQNNFPLMFFMLWVVVFGILLVVRIGREEDFFIGWNILVLVICMASAVFLTQANTAIRILLYVQVFSVFGAGYCKNVIKGGIGMYSVIYYGIFSTIWIYNNYIRGVAEVFPYSTVF